MPDKTHTPTLDDLIAGLEGLGTSLVHQVIVPLVQKVTLVEVTPQFAPGPQVFENGDLDQSADGETCTIKYRVVDPAARLSEGRLEIARKAEPGTPLAILPLSGDALKQGDRTFAWDGRCTEGKMNGKYINAVWSPYVVSIVAKGVKGDLKDDGKETAVVLAELRLDRGRDVPALNPPDAKSDAGYQYRLIVLGYHVGPVDGVVGTKTRRAIKNFQRAHSGLKVTGALDAHTKAVLDEVAPSGTGVDHYQGILNALGYRCGANDGLVGRLAKRAISIYRDDKGLPPGDTLDDAVKAALDGETIPTLERREVLEGDLAGAEPFMNPLPAVGAEKKIFIAADGAFSPVSLPRYAKYRTDQDVLSRPHFPVVVRPLVKRTNGASVFAPAAVGPMRIDFTVDPAVVPPADLDISNGPTRTFVQKVVTKDGGEATTGHHAHKNRGGVRTSAEPGTFLTGKSYVPYVVSTDGNKHACVCVSQDDDPAAGSAGAYFVPSHIGGDRFGVVATVNNKGFDTPPPAPVTVATGTMIVWRRYHVAKLWLMQYVPRPHRTETEPHMGLPPWYDPAFIEWVEPEISPSPIMIKPRSADLREIDLDLYTSILRDAGYRPAQLPDSRIQSRFNAGILWPLRPASVYNAAREQDYYDDVSSEIDAFGERFGQKLRELSYLEDYEGLVVLVFDLNAPPAGQGGIHAMTNPKLQNWAWSVLASDRVVYLIYNQDNDVDAVKRGAVDGETLAHESGHSLWLHHATTEKGKTPDAADQPDHNKPEWDTCTMSYLTLANFCGRCVLKLRGWDEAKV